MSSCETWNQTEAQLSERVLMEERERVFESKREAEKERMDVGALKGRDEREGF